MKHKIMMRSRFRRLEGKTEGGGATGDRGSGRGRMIKKDICSRCKDTDLVS